MPEVQQSRVFMHEDGYIEMVFAGLQAPEQLRTLINDAKSFAEMREDEGVSLLVDARHGHIGRDARTFATLMDAGWVRNLENLVILYSDDLSNEASARPSDIIISVLTNVVRIKPVYLNDEEEARDIVKK